MMIWQDRNMSECFKVFYVKLYLHSLVDKLKWFYENARCYSEIYELQSLQVRHPCCVQWTVTCQYINICVLLSYEVCCLYGFLIYHIPSYFLAPFFIIVYVVVGTAVAQWLRCCATNRKVAGSIPDGVTWDHPTPWAFPGGKGGRC